MCTQNTQKTCMFFQNSFRKHLAKRLKRTMPKRCFDLYSLWDEWCKRGVSIIPFECLPTLPFLCLKPFPSLLPGGLPPVTGDCPPHRCDSRRGWISCPSWLPGSTLCSRTLHSCLVPRRLSQAEDSPHTKWTPGHACHTPRKCAVSFHLELTDRGSPEAAPSLHRE